MVVFIGFMGFVFVVVFVLEVLDEGIIISS